MQDSLRSFLDNIERFLRWLYPGVLLLVLLHMARSNDDGPQSVMVTLRLSEEPTAVVLGGLLGAAIVGSVVLYSLQRYLISEIVVQYLIFWWITGAGDAFQYARVRSQTPNRWNPIHFWGWSNTLRRDTLDSGGATQAWQDYTWAVAHAIGVSAWTIGLVFFFFTEQGSLLDSIEDGWVWLAVSVLGLAWVWQELRSVLAPRLTGRGELPASGRYGPGGGMPPTLQKGPGGGSGGASQGDG